MGASTVQYTQANYGNLGKWFGDKVKSAASMAAEERKYAKEHADQQRKEGVPEEEIKKTGKGYFFGKALSHEFGGDLIRRTRGTFSNDPSDTEDPALTKRQRFSNLVRGGDVVTPQPYKQLELDLGNTGGKDKQVNVEDKKLKSWLTVAFDGVEKSYQTIADKLSNLSKEEKGTNDEQVKTQRLITKVTSGITTVKNFFNKNNKIQEEQNKIESQQLEFNLDQSNAGEMQQRENQLEVQKNSADVQQVDDPYIQQNEDDEGGGKRSLLDRMMDFDSNRYGRPRRRGFKRRYARRKLNNFKRGLGRGARGLRRRGQVGIGRALRRFKLSEGGTAAPNITNNIDQSTEVQTPQAQNNIVPLSKAVEPKTITKPVPNVKAKTKLARGGIVDNPTTTLLSPGQSVIPLNRNNPVASAFKQQKQSNKKDPAGKRIGDQLATALQLPAQAAGGLLLSTMASVFKKLGGVGQMIAPFFTQLFRPLATVFGLPATVVGSLLGGGPAAAATLDSKDIADFLKGGGKGTGSGGKKGGGGGGGGGGNPPGATPGSLIADIQADVGKSAADMKGEISSSGASGIVDPTKDAWCAAYVNSQLKRNGIQGSGSPAADSFEKWGTPVDKNNIQPGDIIVGDYGGGSRSHVMFANGTPKGGYVDLIGGNQSGKVTAGSIALSKIDYVRRASTGNVTTPTVAKNLTNPQPASTPTAPRSPAPKSNRPSTSVVNTGGGSSKAKPAPEIDPIGVASGLLSLSTTNPVSLLYKVHW